MSDVMLKLLEIEIAKFRISLNVMGAECTKEDGELLESFRSVQIRLEDAQMAILREWGKRKLGSPKGGY